MKNLLIMAVLAFLFSIANFFSINPKKGIYKVPVIMNKHVIEREEYRDRLVESVKIRIERNTEALSKIEDNEL